MNKKMVMASLLMGTAAVLGPTAMNAVMGMPRFNNRSDEKVDTEADKAYQEEKMRKAEEKRQRKLLKKQRKENEK